jgi:hypothetical protein
VQDSCATGCQALKEAASNLWADFFFGGRLEIMSWWWWWIIWWWEQQHDAGVAVVSEEIIGWTACW